MASVSLCMIVRNEAHQLADCLAPVAGLFDEIVIVDTGSIDNTRQIAGQFTPHLFDFAWCDDFSAARNESLKHARGEWVFWLDADDRLEARESEKLRRLLETLNGSPAAYLFDTVCAPSDPSDPARVITHRRLFRRSPSLAWHGRVHEQLRPCPSMLGYEQIHCDVRIDHLGYRDATVKQRKLLRDTRLLRLDYAVDPENPSTLLHLGMTYARSGNSVQARKYLMQLLAAGPPSCDYLQHALATLAEMSLSEGRSRESLDIATQALTLFKDNQHFLYLQAESLYELDQYAAARGVLLQIINGPDTPQFRGGAPHEIKTKLAPRCLGEVLRIERQLAAAEGVLKILVQHDPEDLMSWYVLGRVYIDADDWQAIEQIRQRLQASPEGETFALLLLAAWQLQRGKLELADSVVEELIAKAPHLTIARLMRAEVLARRNAPVAARLRAYRDVLRVQPGNTMAAEMIERLTNAPQAPAGEPGWSSPITVPPIAPSVVIYA